MDVDEYLTVRETRRSVDVQRSGATNVRRGGTLHKRSRFVPWRKERDTSNNTFTQLHRGAFVHWLEKQQDKEYDVDEELMFADMMEEDEEELSQQQQQQSNAKTPIGFYIPWLQFANANFDSNVDGGSTLETQQAHNEPEAYHERQQQQPQQLYKDDVDTRVSLRALLPHMSTHTRRAPDSYVGTGHIVNGRGCKTAHLQDHERRLAALPRSKLTLLGKSVFLTKHLSKFNLHRPILPAHLRQRFHTLRSLRDLELQAEVDAAATSEISDVENGTTADHRKSSSSSITTSAFLRHYTLDLSPSQHKWWSHSTKHALFVRMQCAYNHTRDAPLADDALLRVSADEAHTVARQVHALLAMFD